MFVKAIKKLVEVFQHYYLLADGNTKVRLLSVNELKIYESGVNKLNADEQYRLWMHNRYTDFKQTMLDYLSRNEQKLEANIVKVG